MIMLQRWLILPPLLTALALVLLPGRSQQVAAVDALHIVANITYRIQLDQGPVHVSWRVTVANNDPQTRTGQGGIISFYDSLPLPLLRGATNVSAQALSGAPLTVTLDDAGPGPLISASVQFDRRLFYQESYGFDLEYDLPFAREDSLLVTPFYVAMPMVASGDQATVTIAVPMGEPWEVAVEALDCAREGFTFRCSGSDGVYVVALAEVSQPDATASLTSDLVLRGRAVAVTVTHFRGEELWAEHLLDLVGASLPIIEELYGFSYPGPGILYLNQRARQSILGYEGLTACDPRTTCQIAVSPLANDRTVLHELSHLWSGIYAQRWLSEGFADLVASEAAVRLPPGLLRGGTPTRPPATIDLRLDEWGDVKPLIGASAERRAIEDVGYDLSWRFLLLLRDRVRLQALQGANAALALGGQPADSRRFMDVLEEISGQVLDQLFARWVFPDSMAPTLEARREARDRLAALVTQAKAEGLTEDVPRAIAEEVVAWSFDEALAALDRAEAALETYAQVKDPLFAFRRGVEALGLPFPKVIEDQLQRWDFGMARLSLADASKALEAYAAARRTLEAPRSPWTRLGLLGKDPDATLAAASRAFARGDFQSADKSARAAAAMVSDAHQVALRHTILFLGALAVAALAALALLWLSRRYTRPIPGP